MAETAEDTDIGYGTTFAKGSGAGATLLAEVVEFNPPEMSRDSIDFTHMRSPEKWREFKPGLKDGGEATLTYNLIPGEADDDVIADAFSSDTVETWEVTYPNGAKLTFRGFATAHSHATPLDDKMTGSATFKISGKPVITAAA